MSSRYAGPLIALLLIALAAATALPYVRAAALIVRAAEMPGLIGSAGRWMASDVVESIVQIRTREGHARARKFEPSMASRGRALLVSGVHPDGIDDARLVKLARELAAAGVTVVTPEIQDLIHYRVTPRVTDTIEDAAIWMLDPDNNVGAGRLGIIGVSFSGGLAIVAAGRPSLRDRTAYVVSFGGHGNLPRVLEYLCSAHGGASDPHDYSVAIVLHHAAEFVVPADQVDALRSGVETFLAASALSRTEPHEADRLFATARRVQAALPEPSASLLGLVNDRDVVKLGARLRPVVAALGQHPSLSPDRSAPPAAHVYLLHGSEDTVIPPSEAVRLADHLRDDVRVRLFVSRFLTHVDVSAAPGWRETWQMIAFWKAVLAEY